MKKYSIPEMKIIGFSAEDIITESAAGITASEKAEAALEGQNVNITYKMNWVQE